MRGRVFMKLIKSLSEYIEILRELLKDTYLDDQKRVYFRGEDRNYINPTNGEDTRCLPKIFRQGEEKDTLYKFLRRHPDEFLNMSNFEALAKMQHFNIQTRLLDITSNPLVALFFACGGYNFRKDNEVKLNDHNLNSDNEFKDNNGYVYIFSPTYKLKGNNRSEVLTFDSDRVLLLSTFARMTKDEQIVIQEFTKEFECLDDCEFKPEHLVINKESDSNELVRQKTIFKKYIYECERERDAFREHHVNPLDLRSVFFVKPPFINDRIKIQSGLFIIYGNKFTAKNEFDKVYFRNLIFDEKRNNPKIIIDENSKIRILSELKFLCGISYSSLFGGLESTVLEPKDTLYDEFKKTL